MTQSSAGATKVGGAALGASTVIDGTNDTLQLSIDGNPFTLTLAHGTYNATQLAAAVQAASTSAGAPIAASVDAATGKLQLVTTQEGQRRDAASDRRQRARRARSHDRRLGAHRHRRQGAGRRRRGADVHQHHARARR